MALSTTLEAGDWLAISASGSAAVYGAGEAPSLASALAAGRTFAQVSAHQAPDPVGTLDASNLGRVYCLVGVA